MGGGGGSSGSLGDMTWLEQKAKDILQDSQKTRKNVFISFAFEDLNEVNLLRGQAKNENSQIEFNDRSVHEPYDSDRAEYIRQRLRERINQSSTTIVYLSENTSASKWVDWEVRKSVELGKRVIAVHAGGIPPRNVPAAVTEHGIAVVSWSQLAAELRGM
jgi:hypothetical protein